MTQPFQPNCLFACLQKMTPPDLYSAAQGTLTPLQDDALRLSKREKTPNRPDLAHKKNPQITLRV